jgi:CheY-like chemotaxis protein
VATSAAALKALAEETFDVLLVDINIPGTDGATVLREIRAAGHAMPAIMLSGDLGSIEMESLRPLGVVSVMEKSSDNQPLMRVIAELGDGRADG